MTLEAPLLDFDKFTKIELIKKFEYFHINKAFAEVYKVQHKETGEIYYACISRPEENKKHSKTFKRVVSILSNLDQHPSILRFIGYSKFNNDNKLFSAFLTEYYSNGTLKDMIQAERNGNPVKGWNETNKLISIYGIASGMANLHSKDILHRNLSSANILMDDSFHPKIHGFNLLIKTDDKSVEKPIKSTPEYMAPEIIMREASSKPMDVYSFGMIVYEIVTLQHPYEEIKNINIIHVLQKVLQGQMPAFKKSTPKSYQDLIIRCWNKNPEERPTFEEIVHLLKTDEGFITDGVKKEAYYKYINNLEQNYNNDDSKEIRIALSEEDEKVLHEENHKRKQKLLSKSEINFHKSKIDTTNPIV